MFSSPRRDNLSLLLIAVVLASIPFFIPYSGVASIVAFSLLITLARYKNLNSWKIFSFGCFFGFFVIGASIAWLYSSIPFLHTEYGIGMLTGFGLITITFLSVVVPSAIIIGGWMVFISKIRFNTFFDIVSIAVSFTVFEYFRLLIVSFVLLGTNMTLVPHFSFGMLGYSLADYILPLQLAVFGGLYMLSFLAILCAGFFYSAYQNRTRGGILSYKRGSFIALLFGVIFFPHALFPFGEKNNTTPNSLSFAVVTEYFSPDTSFLQKEVYQTLFEHRGVVVFPEGSRLFPPFRTESHAVHNFSISEQPRGNSIIDSGTYVRERGEKVGAAFISINGEAVLLREKEVLTPFGEYMPVYMTFFGTLFGFESVFKELSDARTLAVGSVGTPHVVDGALVTAIFCHEIAVPGFVKTLQKETDADVILVLASTRWFSYTKSLHTQTVRMAKIQAVQARAPLIRASYNDPGFAIDRYGRVLFEAARGEASINIVSIPIPN